MHTAADVTDVLSNHWFLSGLKPEHIARIASCSHEQFFMTNEHLCRWGTESHHFYLVVAGQLEVGVEDPGKGFRVIQMLDAPTVAGICSLSPSYQCCFNCKALTPCETIAVRASELRESMERNPEFGYAFLMRLLSVFVNRLQGSRMQLLDMYH